MCPHLANAIAKPKILVPPNPMLHVTHFYSCLIPLELKLTVRFVSSSWLSNETLLYLLVLPFKDQAKAAIKRSSALVLAYRPTPCGGAFLLLWAKLIVACESAASVLVLTH